MRIGKDFAHRLVTADGDVVVRAIDAIHYG
jgi:hypothetical protein